MGEQPVGGERSGLTVMFGRLASAPVALILLGALVVTIGLMRRVRTVS